MNTFKRKALIAVVLGALAAAASGCAMSEKQINALGPGDKSVCFHARCEHAMCGGNWSTTTSAAAATDGKVPSIGERCETRASGYIAGTGVKP